MTAFESRKVPLRLLLILFVTFGAATLLLLLPIIGASTAEAQGETPTQVTTTLFQANLAGSHEAEPVQTDASGRAVLALEPPEAGVVTATLHYRVMVHAITDVTAAHIHMGGIGESGDVVFPLYNAEEGGTFDPDNPISGTIELDAQQQAALVAGNYYINVHTVQNPGGEIRGQVLGFEPPADYSAMLVGQNETPPVQSDAAGVARFNLSMTDTGTVTGTVTPTLSYYVAVTDIVSVTQAHLHTGFPGESGPPVITLYGGDGEARPFGPDEPISGTVELTAMNLVDLLTGYYYVNVHTEQNPGGEIRGQVSRVHLFGSNLTGEEEVEPVETTATGHSVLALSSDATQLHYRVMVSDITSVTQAHIHAGARGVNGPPVFTLYDASVEGSGTFDPDTPISGTVDLEGDEPLFTLLREGYYVNVHTQQNPGGEIRGQITTITPTLEHFAELSAQASVPPVESQATGRGHFMLDNLMGHLHYQVDVRNIQNVNAAHIHRGARDESGPVVHPLYPTDENQSFGPDDPIGGAVMLEGMDFVDLLTEYFYVNVHTQQNPGGEVRGQITTEEVARITETHVALPFMGRAPDSAAANR